MQVGMGDTNVASRSSRFGTGGIETVLVATDIVMANQDSGSGREGYLR
jgi:glutamate 5-kinase